VSTAATSPMKSLRIGRMTDVTLAKSAETGSNDGCRAAANGVPGGRPEMMQHLAGGHRQWVRGQLGDARLELRRDGQGPKPMDSSIMMSEQQDPATLATLVGPSFRRDQLAVETNADATRAKSRPGVSFGRNSAARSRVLRSGTSRVQFTIKQFPGLFALRGRFDRLEGRFEIGELGSIGVSLMVDGSSVDTADSRTNDRIRSAGLFAPGQDPMIVFQSRYVLLVAPRQIWEMGLLSAAGSTVPVVFEAKLTTHVSHRAVVIDGKFRASHPRPQLTWAPDFRSPTAAVLSLHLVFVGE
jgi:polyisoprenoid-binding protein YceI